MRAAIKASDADNLAFVVVNGIKSGVEPCTDNLYLRRRALLDSAQNGVILSLAGDDWSGCKKDNGRSGAVERLNRIRELFFSDEFSFGASKVPLVHESAMPRFRSYGENTRWEINGMLFATINLPANNNHYLTAAGRNSEFEDRLIANRDWLQRLVHYASNKKLRGIVLFSDGNPLSLPTDKSVRRDGFLETRRQLIAAAEKFTGKILLVHGQPGSGTTNAQGATAGSNLREVGVTSGWIKVSVNPSNAALFSIIDNPVEIKTMRQ